ncbi:Glycosylphosphatidylinositol (GPI) anchor assembly protein, partial [Teratosphaeriaceae sp. CCFEE 6253]
MSAAAPEGKPASVQAPSKPIDILQSQTAFAFANLQPILLLSTLLYSFTSLVADPVSTLLRLAAGTAVLQAIYCVLCLPSTGTAPSPPPKPGQKRKALKPGQDVWAK